MEKEIEEAVSDVRARVATKTLIQDISEPLTGNIDQRRIAAKFCNLEYAVGELADAVDSLSARTAGRP